MSRSRDHFLEINPRDIFRDMLQTNVMYIHVRRCFAEDFLLEIHSGDIFGDMLWTNVMYIHVRRLVSGDELQRYFQRYAPDQCEVYPCPEMVFWRYTPEIFLEICFGPM